MTELGRNLLMNCNERQKRMRDVGWAIVQGNGEALARSEVGKVGLKADELGEWGMTTFERVCLAEGPSGRCHLFCC